MNKKFIKATIVTSVVGLGFAVFFMTNSDYSRQISGKIDTELSEEEEERESMEGMAKYINAIRANKVTGTVSEAEYMQALNASTALSAKRSVNSVWENLGPDNIGGRSRAFLQDIDSSNIMYVAGVSGGLFRSVSKGSSWAPVNDFQENLNIVSIAQNRDRVIVYGTGEGQFVGINGTEIGTPGFAGNGIFRSVNGGYTFTKVNHGSFGNISCLAAEPRDKGSRFYAATDNGVKYSDDGLTWVNAKSGSSKEVKVAVDGTVYAQLGATLQKSTDRGATWLMVTPPGASISRMSIAISPQDPNYVYTMVSNGSSVLDGVYRSENAGATWTKIITGSINYFDPLASTASSQGGYNNVISVDPRNKDQIFMGGVTFAKWVKGNNPQIILSTNDFDANGRKVANYVHADKHIIAWDMSTNPPTIIVGTDGGLFFSSDNLATFTPKNFGFTTYQAYAVAADFDGNCVGGSQDNGTQYINKKGNTPKSSVLIKGGDGFQVEISTKQNNIIFSESQYGNLTRSRDFGKSQSCIWDRRIARSFVGLTDTNKYCEQNHQGNWAPFNMMFKLWEHPVYDSVSRLFIARNNQIWMAENATDINSTPTWYMISSSVPFTIWDLEVTPDGNSVFVGSDGTLQRIDGLNSATYDKWSNPLSIPPGITTTNLNITNAGGRAVTSVNLDPNNTNEALITLGNYGGGVYVMKGTNMLGAPTYTNITNNLPLMPVYDGLISYSSSSLMFLGTDLGVYASDNGGATWTAQTNPTNKFPKVSTFAIRQYYFPNKSKGVIYAGTHGRGFFQCSQYQTSIKSSAVKDNKSFEMTAYPNPASDNVNIRFNLVKDEALSCAVLDVSGRAIKLVKVGMLTKGNNYINIETKEFVSGIYYVTVVGTNNKPKGTIKLIIAH